jgi:hypothetical protein
MVNEPTISKVKGPLKLFLKFTSNLFCLGHAKSPAGKFLNWDFNKDGFISKDEVVTKTSLSA